MYETGAVNRRAGTEAIADRRGTGLAQVWLKTR